MGVIKTWWLKVANDNSGNLKMEESKVKEIVGQKRHYLELFLMLEKMGPTGPPGSHGTFSEQNVPLIFHSPFEYNKDKIDLKIGTEIDKNISVIDIIPAINRLNQWPEQKTFEGKSLF